MAELLLVNPRKRKARKTGAKRRKSVASRAMATVSRKVSSLRKRYRRNPIGGGASGAMEQFKAGAIGAAGALAVDIAMTKLPIPANLKTGAAAPIVKGLVGIGIGMAVAKFGKNKALGKAMAQGAVTVSLYAAGREMLKKPLGLGAYDDLGADFDELGYYEMGGDDDTMGELLGDDDNMGELLGDDDQTMGAYENGAVTYN
jgi:hypothetical protein